MADSGGTLPGRHRDDAAMPQRSLSIPSRSARNTLPMGMDAVRRDAALPWYLYEAHGASAGAIHRIDQSPIQIGREPGDGVDLVLDDSAVSRLHARLSWLPGEDSMWLQDCGSSNGVRVNGRMIDGDAVRAGDVIRLGDSVLVVGRGRPAGEAEASDLGLVGRAPVIAGLREMLRKVAPSALSVLIVGATGTGKELVAKAIHAESGRRGELVAVNCAALPGSLIEGVLFGHRRGAYTGAVADQDGAFVRAHGGTLFLDEVGDMAIEAQPKLLRALENGEITPLGAARSTSVDVRVVAATHVPLDAAMSAGRFRRDLYARLAGVVARTPALADRREDVVPLFRSFLGEGGERPMTADFAESLLLHGWPFNVRGLRKLAERLLVLHADAPRWELAMLDQDLAAGAAGAASPAAEEAPAPREKEGPPTREALVALLEDHGGNVSLVAERLGRNRKQIYRWMDQLAIDRGTGRRP